MKIIKTFQLKYVVDFHFRGFSGGLFRKTYNTTANGTKTVSLTKPLETSAKNVDSLNV